MKVYRVRRNDDIIRAIHDAEQELSDRIMNADPPEPNWEHGTTLRLLNDMHGCEAGEVIELGEDARFHWERMEEIKQKIKELDATKRELQAKLLHAIGPAEIARLPEADYELKRFVIADSYYTEQDVRETKLKVGQVKRKGHVRLTRRKVKKS